VSDDPALYVQPEPEPAPEPEPEPEPAPEPKPEPDPQARAVEDLNRRDRELLAKEQRVAGFARAQELISGGKHREAAEALGIDPHKLLADVWGAEMVPEEKKPSVDEQVTGVREALEETQRQLKQSQAQMARYQIYGKIQAEMGDREDLEVVRHLVRSGGEPFLDQLIDYAVEQKNITGQRPEWSDVLEFAEKTYGDRYCNIADDMLQLKKIKAHLGLKEPEQAPEKQPAPKPAPKKTLTSALDAEPRTTEAPKTLEEKRQAARQFFKDGYARGREMEKIPDLPISE
jgi:hypothetical protein